MIENNINEFDLVATTAYGLEQILADELLAIGAENIELLTRAVSFSGTKELMYRTNLEVRTALRILKPIYSFRATNETELYRGIKEIKWEKYLNPERTFAINSAVHSDYFNHENYVALKSKDAIVDQLRVTFGTRPNVDVTNPDLRINIHISGNTCNVLLDSSGNSLHKRGYRIGQGLAPINEVLAAGMILLTGWKGDSDFIDPMCGSGTFLMEAATIAYNIAPGIKISEFGFMKWDDYEPELWEKVRLSAISREKEFNHKIIGFDESPKAIKIAKENIKNAELGWKVILKAKAIEEIRQNDLTDGGTVMLNPPYGERMNESDTLELYETIGDCLKQNFNGYSVWIISSNKEALKKIGLRTSKKITLYNGSLECKFHNFQIYKGSIKSKYLNKEDVTF